MIKKTIVNTIVYGIGPQIPKFAGIVILPLITPYLTAADFGIFGVIQAYGLALSYLKTLGTDVVLSNVYVKHPRHYVVVWRHIAGMLHVWAFLVSIIFALIIIAVLKPDHPHLTEIIILNVVPLAIFATTENQFFRYYQLQQRPWPISIRVIVTGLINVVVTYYTIRVLQLGYRGWFYASFIASLASFLWILYPLYIRHKLYPSFRLKWRSMKRTLRISLPILPHFYGNYLLSSADRVVLDWLKVSHEGIGRYNAAYLFGNYFTILATASKRAIGPMLQLLYSKSQWKKAKLLVFYWSAAFLILTSTVSIWIREIIPFFIRTPGMEGIYGMAIWIIMANNYVPMYSGANSQIFYFEETGGLWKRAFAAFAINVGMNLILVPYGGVYFAAVSSFVSYMYLAYSSFWMKGYRSRKVENLRPAKWFLATVGATISCLVIAEFDIWIKAVLSAGLLLGLVYFVFKILKQRREARRV
jgi:O-antigen/teichoic acid export membrane protein